MTFQNSFLDGCVKMLSLLWTVCGLCLRPRSVQDKTWLQWDADFVMPVLLAGSWDLSQVGLVYGLAMGPYGTVLALCWDKDGSLGSGSTLVLLHSDPSMRPFYYHLFVDEVNTLLINSVLIHCIQGCIACTAPCLEWCPKTCYQDCICVMGAICFGALGGELCAR